MVKVETKLSGDLVGALNRYESKIKQQLLFTGTAEAARVVYEEVQVNASGARKGGPGDPPGRFTGNLSKSIYRAYIPERSSDELKTYIVTWRHKDAPHGHLLEFGTSRSPAYPFVRPAVARIPEALKSGLAKMERRS